MHVVNWTMTHLDQHSQTHEFDAVRRHALHCLDGLRSGFSCGIARFFSLLLWAFMPLAHAATPAQVFAWAAGTFPGAFSGEATAGQFQQYNYRLFAGTGNAVAVDTAGTVFVLGPVTRNVLTSVGPASRFEPDIARWEAAQLARGTLLATPGAPTAVFTAASLKSRLSGSTRDRAVLNLTGDPVCGVTVYNLPYATVGGRDEAATASTALMVPTGSVAKCTGARPVVLYGHGTNPAKPYNLASLAADGNPAYYEGLMLAAFYAAQGYIVVAPNYAGYDTSDLPYHAFLVARQQSRDMLDALHAARTALPLLPSLEAPVAADSRLFLTGYSQGGHVAMATHRAMQEAGISVTASAPMSGPYALAAMADDVFFGRVAVGATLFAPLLASGYHSVYQNLYNTPGELFESAYASGIEGLLPGPDVDVLLATRKLPEFALFSNTVPQVGTGTALQTVLNANTPPSGTPRDKVYSRGFGNGNLLSNAARVAYLQDALNQPDGAMPAVTTRLPAAAPQHPLRVATRLNDLRGWAPTSPLLLCGGNEDPTVSYPLNTKVMADLWANLPAGLVTVLDIDSRATTGDPFRGEKQGFALIKTTIILEAQFSPKDPDIEIANAYHVALVPFCNSAARKFFERFK